MVFARVLREGLDDLFGAAIPINPCTQYGSLAAKMREVYGPKAARIKAVKVNRTAVMDGVEQTVEVAALPSNWEEVVAPSSTVR
eukprot:gene1910-7850_t